MTGLLVLRENDRWQEVSEMKIKSFFYSFRIEYEFRKMFISIWEKRQMAGSGRNGNKFMIMC